MLHELFDACKKKHCVLLADQEWIVWDFDVELPFFEEDEFELSNVFPVFANVYQVTVTKKGTQSFLQWDCRMYERCGIPCSHIFVITNEIEETMISVQVSERNKFIYVNSYR
jgi:hypothetical protein